MYPLHHTHLHGTVFFIIVSHNTCTCTPSFITVDMILPLSYSIHSPRSALRSATRDGMLLRAPATRNVLVQTDYRDSETQTDPYSPEYLVQPGSVPELLTIASLCHGNVVCTLLLVTCIKEALCFVCFINNKVHVHVHAFPKIIGNIFYVIHVHCLSTCTCSPQHQSALLCNMHTLYFYIHVHVHAPYNVSCSIAQCPAHPHVCR